MAKVTNLAIKLQSGTDNTYYASWDFAETTTTTTSGVKKGDLVSIKSGATYYNGVAIPSWVMNDQWYISYLSGNRAVLGKNASGSNNINSPVHTQYLTGGSGSSSTVSTNNLDHYEVKWSYETGDGVWFEGSSSSVTTKNATYSPPDNALKFKVSVKPVSKTRKVNDKETPYWTGTSVSETFVISNYHLPEKPSTPTVKIEKYKLTASLENISDARTDRIQFQVYNGTKVVKTGTVTVETCRASFTCDVTAGGEYRVRCRSVSLYGSTPVYSEEWSDFSGSLETIPSAPSSITSIKASSETSVYLEWSAVSTAKTYDIEYTTKKNYFDGSDQTTTQSGIEFNHFEKTGLESGQEYFFRVRAVNDQGYSAWSGIKSVIIGKDPAAPTTWSSTTTVIAGNALTLYWVHNSEDGSSQTFAELELYINGVKETHTIQNSTDEEEKDKTSFYAINTSSYTEGVKIQWRVRTAGITKVYGDWSIQRTVDVYAPPTLELTMTDVSGNSIETLTSFPFYLNGLAGPNTQEPIGYHVTIVANEGYETVDRVGNVKMVNQGDAVYSQYFDTKEVLLLELSASSLDLQNGVSYTIQVVVSMNSGLTGESSLEFNVSWTDEEVRPDAELTVDRDIFVAYIRPYCRDEFGVLVDNISLSVYRLEFDGSFTELATGIDNALNTVITDPHPALDYARYRIVAISNDTGAVSYYDIPGYPVGGKAVIIQWEEEWKNFYTTNSDLMEEPPWSGSFLKLPYNIDVSDNHKPDVQLVEYIGREHPISYYGTQLGTTATWNVVIEKNDEETLYALRRLSRWMGDVYVREPSGSGYWANITVSFSQKHLDLTIPVTLEIARVEGGV